MKIVCVDNYDRESVDDQLVCENINEYYGSRIVGYLNEQFVGDSSPNFYKLVDNDYSLYVWEP